MGFLRSSILSVVMTTLLSVLSIRGECPEGCTCDEGKARVDCQGALLTHIPWDLPDPIGLKELDLSHNNIQEVISDIESYPNLEFLDLSYNGLIKLEDKVFQSLSSLRVLHLHQNNIQTLNRGTLDGLANLNTLNIANNELEMITGNVFSNMKKLTDLNLANNNIQAVSSRAFMGLKSLYSLSLSSNKLTQIPQNALRGTPELKKLFLDINMIENIPEHAFKNVQQLKALSLEGNVIKTIDDYAFHDKNTADMPMIEKMTLKDNKIEVLPKVTFERMKNLVTLDISANPLEEIVSDSFLDMERLKSIFINNMPNLKIVRQYAFSELLELQLLELHSNHLLSTIENEAFVGLPKLERLDLHANALGTIPAGVADWHEISVLDLRYNPWKCDCHLQFISDILKSQKTNQSIQFAKQVACNQPDSLAAQNVINLQKEDFTCTDTSAARELLYDRILIGIIAGGGSLILVLLLFFLYKHDYFKRCKEMTHGSVQYQYSSNQRDSEVTFNGLEQRQGILHGDKEASVSESSRLQEV